MTRPTRNGLQRLFPTGHGLNALLPWLPPIVVLFQQPLHLVADPTPNGIEVEARTTLPRASTGHAINKLTTGFKPLIQTAIARISRPLQTFVTLLHGSRLTTPAAQPMLPAESDQRNCKATALKSEPKNVHSAPSLHRLIVQQTTGMPTPPVMLIATRSASRMTSTAAARGPSLAAGTNRHPPRRPDRDWIVVTHAHLKAALRSIDGGHLSPKQGAMAFPTLLHQIDPGVNHFVAQGAFRGLLWQRFQHGPR